MDTKSEYLVGKECPITRLPSTFPKTIDENLSLGLDVGIGSCGQALVTLNSPNDAAYGKLPPFSSRIRFLGVRAFDVPEKNEKTGVTLKNPERRSKRLLRRLIRRRAERMQRIRNLFKRVGLLPCDYDITNPYSEWRKKHESATPWTWRVDGLSAPLDPWPWAAVLMHFAKHRGFKSNKKSDRDSKGKEGGTLQSVKENAEILKGFQTAAEMMAKSEKFNDPKVAGRKRNREGLYIASIQRADLEQEIQTLFAKQREFGNPYSSEELERVFLEIFNHQRGLQDPIDLLGNCSFEKEEYRASVFSFSFELSRALQKLNTLTLLLPNGAKVRLADHVNALNGGYAPFLEHFGQIRKVSWKALRDLFKLEDQITFLDLPAAKSPNKKKKVKKGKEDAVEPESHQTRDLKDVSLSPELTRKEMEKLDFVTRSKECAEGSFELRKVLGHELWQHSVGCGDLESIDNAAFCLSFFDNIDALKEALRERFPVSENIRLRVLENIDSDSSALLRFKGAVSLSSKASRKLLPHLKKGLVYSEACEKAGYVHTDRKYALKDIVNPVVQSVVRETMKQVVYLIEQAGALPGRICVELSRDLGKSIEERNEIHAGISERTDEKNSNRETLETHLGSKPSDDKLLRYELYLEQSNLCPYCGETIEPPRNWEENALQVDHILPRSRSHDNSYNNKVLVHTGCNQNKKSRTPAEYFGAAENTENWRRLVATLGQMPRLRAQKRRNLLNTTFADDEIKFISRNLNDTRYISKIILAYLNDLYRLVGEDPEAKGAKRRVFAQPGALTALVRKAWGLEDLKKDSQGNRIGDKHHAVDALVCACLSEGQRHWITRLEQHRLDSTATSNVQGDSGERRFYDGFEALTDAYAEMELRGESKATPLRLRPPWENLREETISALDRVTVSRRENRRGRGSLHKETFYRVEKDENGEEVYYLRTSLREKKPGGNKYAATLTSLEDIKRVKGIDEPINKHLKAALESWIERGSPVDDLPRVFKGKTEDIPQAERLLNDDPKQLSRWAVVRTVTLAEAKAKTGRLSPHGQVVGGDIVRVDVFSKAEKNKPKKYFLVPVYTYHLKDIENPPKRAVSTKDEDEWESIDETYTFEFSLWPNSPFEVKKGAKKKSPQGEHLLGYYSGVDRATAALTASDLNSSHKDNSFRFSVKENCTLFQKLNIDRLGRVSVVKGEKRTWHGKVCT